MNSKDQLVVFDLELSHQDWILSRVTLLNLARHPPCPHFLWEKKKSNCQRSNYQWEWERHPLHPETTCVLFHSKISFISLKPWQRVMTWLIKNCLRALSPSSVKKRSHMMEKELPGSLFSKPFHEDLARYIGQSCRRPTQHWQVRWSAVEYKICTARAGCWICWRQMKNS